jgi:hypothetical protein
MLALAHRQFRLPVRKSGKSIKCLQRQIVLAERQMLGIVEGVSERSGTWGYEGRYYAVTAFSDVAARDGYGWELEDVAPAPGLGPLAEAFLDDTTGKFTFRSFTDRPLPFEVIERFVSEASQGVPPSS